MEPNDTAEPTYYNSIYPFGVDEKRRVQVPAKWRPTKPGIEFTVMLWPKSKEGPCLRVLPPQEMAEAAGIVDEAVLVGLLDRFEIWNPERFEKVKASDAIMAQEAFKLME